jgi:hypothetical protein
MKGTVLTLAVLASLFGSTAAFANADDTKWIAQCLIDNKDEKASTDVIQKYCTCMNDKMDANETKSITQWEKTHKKEQAQCDKEAGWK